MPDTISRELARYDPIETENYHLHLPSVDGNSETGVSGARDVPLSANWCQVSIFDVKFSSLSFIVRVIVV